MSSLLRLFETLPEDLTSSRPALGVFYAWALTFSGQFDEKVLWDGTSDVPKTN